ncbi:UvrD-helicase domain-containing protein [Flavobacterium sp.]|uniref:UvrD-helicase domain-containing protein n=1 Tax=Flavobacterium sp. TaxID=239 RepID=UPI002FD8E6C7
MKTPAFSIYDASAGSGKTFTLVKEYLKIILTSDRDDAYKNILAITFTNKAVGEMKARVVETLSEFAKEVPSPKAQNVLLEILKETSLTPERIKQKSKIIIRNIIHNYASFDISTIDKFTHRVIRAFAHDLNLPSTFEVSLETDNLLQEATDAVIAMAGEEDFLTQVLIDFSLEKTDEDRSWDITRDIKEMSKLLTNENNRSEMDLFKETTVVEFVTVKKKLTEQSMFLSNSIQKKAQETLQIIHSNHLNAKSFYRSIVYNILVKLANGVMELKQTYFDYLEEGKRYSKVTPKNEQEALDSLAPELIRIGEELEKALGNYFLVTAFLKNIVPLSLLNRVSQELAKIQEEQNIVSISEFNAIIHNEIQNQPSPFIYERMGERYKHFFIDEFQDTSELQWENLIPLIDNALSSEDLNQERGSLLIVGDPKQSIYRWRGGKAEQFIALSQCNNPFVNPDKKLFHLQTNWRSYSQIIAFNNAFFKFLSGNFTNPDYKNLYENQSSQFENDKKGGYVNLSFVPNTSESEEVLDKSQFYLEAVLQLIQKLKNQNFDYQDIVVLTRKKEPGTLIAAFLTENGIPIVSSESLLLQNSTDVMFCITTLRLLKNGNDKEAKAAFLYYLSQKKQNTLEKHDFIVQGMNWETETAFENGLRNYGFDFSFSALRKKSLYEVVEIIIKEFIKPQFSNAYLQDFLDRVLERNVKNQSGISDFLQYWDKQSKNFSIPSPEGNNAIRIMTIHKSKGLEFPVVIFPFAEESYSSSPKELLWVKPNQDLIPLPRILINQSKSVSTFGAEAAALYEQKNEEILLDNTNILYVALTRAEEQLYVISRMILNKEGKASANNMSSFFINFLENQDRFNPEVFEYDWGNPERVSVPKNNKRVLIPIAQTETELNSKAIKIAQRESLMWGTKQQDAIAYGNLIHELASYIKTNNDIPKAVLKGIEKGLITVSQSDAITHLLNEICFHPELEVFFSTHKQVRNEQSIVSPSGFELKPDRIVIDNKNQVYLLDYKTGEKTTKHQQQLNSYANLLNEMGYTVVKKVLVYIGDHLEIVTL